MGNKIASVKTTTKEYDVQFQSASGQHWVPIHTLGRSRIFKTMECFDHSIEEKESKCVVKVFLRNKNDDNFVDIDGQKKKLQEFRNGWNMREYANILPYDVISVTDESVFLSRPIVCHSLSKRMHSVVPMTLWEKKWIMYQILQALRQCRRLELCHGDIKTQNIMLTSWGWAFLTDFAPFKPSTVPADNPSEFFFYFDTSDRRTCFLSPERLDSRLRFDRITPRMDMFSVGCVFAEMLLDLRQGWLDYSKALAFKKGEIDIDTLLGGDIRLDKLQSRPEEAALLSWIRKMMSLNPLERPTVDEILSQSDVFPRSFSSMYWNSLRKILEMNSVERIENICSHLEEFRELFDGERHAVDFGWGHGDWDGDLERRRDSSVEALASLTILGLSDEVTSDPRQIDDDASSSATLHKEPTLAHQGFPLTATAESSLHAHHLDEKHGGMSLPLSSDENKRSGKHGIHHSGFHHVQIATAPLQPSSLLTLELKAAGVVPTDTVGSAHSVPPEPSQLEKLVDDIRKGLDIHSQPSTRSSSPHDGIPLTSTAGSVFEPAKLEFLGDVGSITHPSDVHGMFESSIESLSTTSFDAALLALTRGFDQHRHDSIEHTLVSAEEHASRKPGEWDAADAQDKWRLSPAYGQFIILITIITTSLGVCEVPHVRQLALEGLKYILPYVDDEVKLRRILPFFVASFRDPVHSLRALALDCCATLFQHVSVFKPVHAKLFDEHIFHSIQMNFVNEDEGKLSDVEIVRVAFARNLPLLAYQSRRVLEHASGLGEVHFDLEIQHLHDKVNTYLLAISSDPSSRVRAEFMKHLVELSVFFGPEATRAKFLPILLTMLNGCDWNVKEAFLRNLPRLCTHIGARDVETIIFPFLLSTVLDFEPVVIMWCLVVCAYLLNKRLITDRERIVELCTRMSCLLVHPFVWIRKFCIRSLAVAAHVLGRVDAFVYVGPVLKPFVRSFPIYSFESNDLEALVLPALSSDAYQMFTSCTEQSKKVSCPPEEKAAFDLLKPLLDIVGRGIQARKAMSFPDKNGGTARLDEVEDLEGISVQTQKMAPDSTHPMVRAIEMRMSVMTPSSPSLRHRAAWVPNGTLLAHARHHKAAITSVCMLEGREKFCTGSLDGNVLLWDLGLSTKSSSLFSERLWKSKSERVHSIGVLSSDKIVITGTSNYAHVVSMDGGKLLDEIPIDNPHQHSICTILPNDVYLVSTAEDVVGIDPRAGSSPSFHLPHDRSRGIVTSMASLSRGNAVLTGTQRGWLHLFDLRFICRVGAFSHPVVGTQIQSISACKTDHQAYVAGGVREVRQMDVISGKTLTVYRYQDGPSPPAHFSAFDPKTKGILATSLMMESQPSPCVRSVLSDNVNDFFIITGGTDGIPRYWSNDDVSRSHRFGSSKKIPYALSTTGDDESVVAEPAVNDAPTEAQRGDVIMAMCLSEEYSSRHRFLITCSRDGMVKLWS